jgi:GDPmannose 4,6-dehydratase
VTIEHLLTQLKKPDDFVISTEKQYTVKYFVNLVAKELNMKIKWKGKGLSEKGFDKFGNCIIECKKRYLRPLEVNSLLGDSKKARRILKWKPKYNIIQIAKEMVEYEVNKIVKQKF